MAAGGDGFDRVDVAVSREQRDVEIVYRGTDVSREEIKCVAEFRSWRAVSDSDWKMLFAGRERGEFRVSENDAGGNAGIGGDRFVAGIAGDDAGMWMTHDAG